MNNIKIRSSLLSLCEEVVQSEQWEHYRAGEIMIHAGDALSKVFIVKSGGFKLLIEHNQEKLTIGYFVPGDLTGLSITPGTLHPYTIQAVADSEVYVWEQSRITELMNLIPGIGNSIKATYAMWAQKIVERFKSLVFLTSQQRVAAWVSDYHRFEVYHRNKIWTLLSAKDMAEYCYVSVSEFDKVINDLVKNNIIVLQDGDCKLLDREKLHYVINAT
jgi:CRP-like cAMP-binding protein